MDFCPIVFRRKLPIFFDKSAYSNNFLVLPMSYKLSSQFVFVCCSFVWIDTKDPTKSGLFCHTCSHSCFTLDFLICKLWKLLKVDKTNKWYILRLKKYILKTTSFYSVSKVHWFNRLEYICELWIVSDQTFRDWIQ